TPPTRTGMNCPRARAPRWRAIWFRREADAEAKALRGRRAGGGVRRALPPQRSFRHTTTPGDLRGAGSVAGTSERRGDPPRGPQAVAAPVAGDRLQEPRVAARDRRGERRQCPARARALRSGPSGNRSREAAPPPRLRLVPQGGRSP